MTVTTSLDGDANTNTVGPHYAIANTAIWYFYASLTLYSDTVPVVTNNGMPVAIQGYLVENK